MMGYPAGIGRAWQWTSAVRFRAGVHVLQLPQEPVRFDDRYEEVEYEGPHRTQEPRCS